MLQMILAGAYTTWYWTSKKSDVSQFSTLASSTVQAFRYHIGTVAFGSLINYFCSSICFIFGIQSTRNCFGPCMCVRYCCASHLVETFRRFNENAFIVCAMHGDGLCSSATKGYQLIFRNLPLFISTNMIFGIIFYFSKFLSTLLSGVIANAYYVNLSMSYWIELNTILGIGAFLVFDLFASVYSTAIDTLMVCARE